MKTGRLIKLADNYQPLISQGCFSGQLQGNLVLISCTVTFSCRLVVSQIGLAQSFSPILQC